MTKRVNYLIVALETGIREDDAQPLIVAIKQIRGVEDVKLDDDDSDFALYTAKSRIKQEWGEKIWGILHPKEDS